MGSKSEISILVVDDDDLIRISLGSVLKRHFKEVRIAKDGSDALRIMQNWKPDLLITDYHMPLVDGYTLIHRARVMYPEIQSIILTAYSENEVPSPGDDQGVLITLMKPINMIDFMNYLKKEFP